MRPKLALALLGSFCALAGCVQPDLARLSLSAAALSVVIIEPGDSSHSTLVYAGPPELAVLRADRLPDSALLFSFPRSYEALDLSPAPTALDFIAPPRVELPPPLDRFRFQDGQPVRTELSTEGLLLPPFDWEAITARGGCADGFGYVASGATCGSTLAVHPTPPEPPSMIPAQGCPPGWSQDELSEARGGNEEPLTVGYCKPPIRLACPPDTLQAAGDLACRPVGSACPENGEFSSDLPGGARTVYVQSGAAGGDGSRERPFGSLALARPSLRAGDVLALGRGQYSGDLALSVQLTVVGACASDTILQGQVSSSASVELRHLSLAPSAGRTALSLQPGASAVVRGAIIVGDGPGTILVGPGASLTVEGARVGGPAVASVDHGILSLNGVDWVGGLRAQGSTLSLSGSALTATSADAISDTVDTRLQIQASYLNTQVSQTGRGGSIEVRDSAFFVAHPGPVLRATGSILGIDGPVTVRRSTFTSTTILVPPPVPGAPQRTQTAITVRGAKALIEDVVLRIGSADIEALVDGLGLSDWDQPGTGEIHRVLLEGGARSCAICAYSDQVLATDIFLFGGYSSAMEVAAREGLVQRVEAHFGCDAIGVVPYAGHGVQVRVEDLRSVEPKGKGLRARSRGAAMRLEFERVAVTGAGEAGIELNGVVPFGEIHQGDLQVRGRLLAVDARGFYGALIHQNAEVDLRDFSLRAGSSAILLRAVDSPTTLPIRLRAGTLEAPSAAVHFERGADTQRWGLLDRVRVRSTRVFEP
ncbi:MAG: hypothetical protein U1E65_09230 [Myxococcota bacterium]